MLYGRITGGDGVPSLLGPVVLLALALASWALGPASRNLAVVHIPAPRSTARAELPDRVTAMSAQMGRRGALEAVRVPSLRP